MGGGLEKASKYSLEGFGGASPTSSSKAFINVVPDHEARDFSARWDSVLEWESLNTPASRKQGLAILLQIENEQRCDPWLWRPLHYACLYNFSTAVEALVEHRAEIDARTGGAALIGKALTKGSFNFCSELECIIRGRPVRVRAEEVSGDTLTIMKADNANVRWNTSVDACLCVDYTPLNPPPHLRHFSYVTPLHIAVEFQHLETIQALLTHKANPNAGWNDGRNLPLHTAIWQGNYKAVGDMLQHNADPNLRDSWSRTPLATAAICPKRPPRVVAVMLLESGAKRAGTDNLGKTAAQLARESDNIPFSDAVEGYVLGGWKDTEEQKRLEMKESTPDASPAVATADQFFNRLGSIQWDRPLAPSFPDAFAKISYHPPKLTNLVRTPTASPKWAQDTQAADSGAQEAAMPRSGGFKLGTPPMLGQVATAREGGFQLGSPPMLGQVATAREGGFQLGSPPMPGSVGGFQLGSPPLLGGPVAPTGTQTPPEYMDFGGSQEIHPGFSPSYGDPFSLSQGQTPLGPYIPPLRNFNNTLGTFD